MGLKDKTKLKTWIQKHHQAQD